MKRTIPAVLAGLTVASLAYASASALTVNASPLQAGSTQAIACDSNGVLVDWVMEVDDDSVYSVRVSDIDADCKGAELFVAVNGVKVASGVVIDAEQETVSFAEGKRPAPADVEKVQVWIG